MVRSSDQIVKCSSVTVAMFCPSIHLGRRQMGQLRTCFLAGPWQSHLTYPGLWAAQHLWRVLTSPSLSRLLHSPCVTLPGPPLRSWVEAVGGCPVGQVRKEICCPISMEPGEDQVEEPCTFALHTQVWRGGLSSETQSGAEGEMRVIRGHGQCSDDLAGSLTLVCSPPS
jgi:hypothetical protein